MSDDDAELPEWVDNLPEPGDGRPILPISQLDAGETLQVVFHDSGREQDMGQYEVRVWDVELTDIDADIDVDVSGPDAEEPELEPAEPGEDYRIMTGSNRFAREVSAIVIENTGDLAGVEVAIESNGETGFDRDYSVSEV